MISTLAWQLLAEIHVSDVYGSSQNSDSFTSVLSTPIASPDVRGRQRHQFYTNSTFRGAHPIHFHIARCRADSGKEFNHVCASAL